MIINVIVVVVGNGSVIVKLDVNLHGMVERCCGGSWDGDVVGWDVNLHWVGGVMVGCCDRVVVICGGCILECVGICDKTALCELILLLG